MGPASDLGPLDPQIFWPERSSFVACKDVVAAVDQALAGVQAAPHTYPIYAAMLGGITAIFYQQAKAAMERSAELLELALQTRQRLTGDELETLTNRLRELLIERPKIHSALFGPDEAVAAGLPVKVADSGNEQWCLIWRLWTRYAALGKRVYESARASQVLEWEQLTSPGIVGR